MQGYEWPGNVRQLLNTVENMLIMMPVDDDTVESLTAS